MQILEQLKLLKRGTVEVFTEAELAEKLTNAAKDKRQLRIKLGLDPTSPDIHLGHTVVLRKMRQFQDLGHKAVLIIGDYTARIGDPTGQNTTRPMLSPEQIDKNAKTYFEQAGKILDTSSDKLEVRHNSEWLEKMTLMELIQIAAKKTIAQMLQRDSFKLRLEKGIDVYAHEFIYPLMQGYDSVVLEADVELGGTDQIFNLLVGRQFQRDFNQPQQVVITLPLLEGTDGVAKMSKSFGNYIGINEPAKEIFGKLMSISDEIMLKYYELLTDEDLNSVRQMHPKEAKVNLAKIIITQYHGALAAEKEAQEFSRVFSQKKIPQDIPIFKTDGKKTILTILTESNLVASGNEARRLIMAGSVTCGTITIKKADFIPQESEIIKVGSRRFLKIIS